MTKNEAIKETIKNLMTALVEAGWFFYQKDYDIIDKIKNFDNQAGISLMFYLSEMLLSKIRLNENEDKFKNVAKLIVKRQSEL